MTSNYIDTSSADDLENEKNQAIDMGVYDIGQEDGELNWCVCKDQDERSQILHEMLMGDSCKSLSIYEYYDGYHVDIDNEKFILNDIGNIFEIISKLNNLCHFTYGSRFPTEIDYSRLFVPKNLKKLSICNMNGIHDSKQFGNIETLETTYSFKFGDQKKLTKTLKNLTICVLDVENEKQYDEIVQYFVNNKIIFEIFDYGGEFMK